MVRVRIEGRELVLGLTEGAFQLLSESGESTLPGPVLAPKRQVSADYNAVHAPTTATDPDTQKKLRMFKQRLAQALREESGPGERASGPSGTIVAGGQDRESWSEREIA